MTVHEEELQKSYMQLLRFTKEEPIAAWNSKTIES